MMLRVIVLSMLIVSVYNSFLTNMCIYSCFPHVVNLACKDVLEDLKENPNKVLETKPDAIGAEYDALSSYEDTLLTDPVGSCRTLVSKLRVSDGRRHNLHDSIVRGNASGAWKDQDGKAIKIREVQLLRDCDTRWSSIYMMLQRVIELYPVCSKPLLNSI
jgi:hypothetical protein